MEDFLHGNIPLNAKAPCTLKAITQGGYTCQNQISVSWKLGPKRVPIGQVIPCVLFAEKKIQTVTCRSLHYNYCHKRPVHNTFPKKLNITNKFFIFGKWINRRANWLFVPSLCSKMQSLQLAEEFTIYKDKYWIHFEHLWNSQNYWDMEVLIWGRKRRCVNSKLLLQH